MARFMEMTSPLEPVSDTVAHQTSDWRETKRELACLLANGQEQTQAAHVSCGGAGAANCVNVCCLNIEFFVCFNVRMRIKIVAAAVVGTNCTLENADPVAWCTAWVSVDPGCTAQYLQTNCRAACYCTVYLVFLSWRIKIILLCFQVPILPQK